MKRINPSLKDFNYEGKHEELLTLSLSNTRSSPPPPSSLSTQSQDFSSPISSSLLQRLLNPLAPPPPSTAVLLHDPSHSHQDRAGPSRFSRAHRTQTPALRPGKTETIPAPYPWAATKRASIHKLRHLLSAGMNKISGQVQCKRCERRWEIQYDLEEKFMEVAFFVSKNKDTMHDRAPAVWMNPGLPGCDFCKQKNCAKPVIAKKRSINWLFLLLGQMLGCCKLKELKYFCKHTRNHRTGAKDRVLYLTYLELCKQLDPEGPFYS